MLPRMGYCLWMPSLRERSRPCHVSSNSRMLGSPEAQWASFLRDGQPWTRSTKSRPRANSTWKVFRASWIPQLESSTFAVCMDKVSLPMAQKAHIDSLKPAGATERPEPRIFVLANQKGGVGKTTTAINLGTALAAFGERVLIIDLDPQGNASTGLGIDRKARISSSYDALVGDRTLAQILTATAVPRLFIAPSTMDLLGLELEISGHPDRSYKLKTALNAFFAHGNGDARISYVLIDCPPSLNLLTINALAAADAVVVPLQCEFFALEGLSQLLSTVDHVRRSLNPALSIHGIVLTMFDPRNSLASQVVADVRAFMGRKVYDTVIPRNVRVSEAPSHGKPVLLYDLKCSGSQAYLKLASEIIQREGRWRIGSFTDNTLNAED